MLSYAVLLQCVLYAALCIIIKQINKLLYQWLIHLFTWLVGDMCGCAENGGLENARPNSG